MTKMILLALALAACTESRDAPPATAEATAAWQRSGAEQDRKAAIEEARPKLELPKLKLDPALILGAGKPSVDKLIRNDQPIVVTYEGGKAVAIVVKPVGYYRSRDEAALRSWLGFVGDKRQDGVRVLGSAMLSDGVIIFDATRRAALAAQASDNASAAIDAEFKARAEALAAANAAEMIDQRSLWPNIYADRMRKEGNVVLARATGSGNQTFWLEWGSCSGAVLETMVSKAVSDFGVELKKLGYTRVECFDGFQTWNVTTW